VVTVVLFSSDQALLLLARAALFDFPSVAVQVELEDTCKRLLVAVSYTLVVH